MNTKSVRIPGLCQGCFLERLSKSKGEKTQYKSIQITQVCFLSLSKVYCYSGRTWFLDSVEESSIIRKSKWKHPVEECINNNVVIQANDAKSFSIARVSIFHREYWLLVFCFTYLPISKRIILTKVQILYFSGFIFIVSLFSSLCL